MPPLPGADFRTNTKVMLDPTEVAFQLNWMRDYNQSATFNQKITDTDAKSIMVAVRKGFDAILSKAFADAGYTVVTTADKDVLRLRSAILDLTVTAPDIGSVDEQRLRPFRCGEATLVLRGARFDAPAQVLGRAQDSEIAGASLPRDCADSGINSTGDFTALAKTWADASVKGMANLKASSPFEPSSAKR